MLFKKTSFNISFHFQIQFVGNAKGQYVFIIHFSYGYISQPNYCSGLFRFTFLVGNDAYLLASSAKRRNDIVVCVPFITCEHYQCCKLVRISKKNDHMRNFVLRHIFQRFENHIFCRYIKLLRNNKALY